MVLVPGLRNTRGTELACQVCPLYAGVHCIRGLSSEKPQYDGYVSYKCTYFHQLVIMLHSTVI